MANAIVEARVVGVVEAPAQLAASTARGGRAHLAAGFLLGVSSIFAVVGLAAPWGAVTLSGGVASGKGTFTLWHITIASDVLGIKMPDTTTSIDDGLCGNGSGGAGAISWTTEGSNICGTFGLIRTLTILTLVAAGLAFGCSVAVCVRARQGAERRIGTFAAASLSAVAGICAAVALGEAATLAKDSPQFEGIAAHPGAGSICMALLVLMALAAAVLEIKSWPFKEEAGAKLGGAAVMIGV